MYLLVETAGRAPLWVVTADALLPDADQVHVHVVRQVASFESKRLARTFSPLAFAMVERNGS